MAIEPDVFTGCFFQWKIDDLSQCWWMKKSKCIDSPTFIADGIGGSKWSLSFYPLGYTNENFVGVVLNREADGLHTIEVNYKLSICKNGSSDETNPKKYFFNEGDVKGEIKYELREKIFFTEREIFLPQDTLTVQCEIWNPEKTPIKLKHLYALSTFKTNRMHFTWRIRNVSFLTSCPRKKVKNNLVTFDLVLRETFDRMEMDMISLDGGMEYISCNISILDSESKMENCGKKQYFSNDLKNEILPPIPLDPKKFIENKSQYLPNGDLTLDFEFVFSTVQHLDYRSNPSSEDEPYVASYVRKEKYRLIKFLSDDLKSMLNDGIFSDAVIRTSKQKFSVHKAILSARSLVFNRMFSNDMMEARGGHVDVVDFDDNTIHRMLLYIYTDSLEGLQFENALELYKIADKYQIQSLKNNCSSFLLLNLGATNACVILSLAVQYQDEDLTKAVKDYILAQDSSFFLLQEWIDFMENDKELALELLYKRVCPKIKQAN